MVRKRRAGGLGKELGQMRSIRNGIRSAAQTVALRKAQIASARKRQMRMGGQLGKLQPKRPVRRRKQRKR